MQADHVGGADQLVQSDAAHAHLGEHRMFIVHHRVEGDDLHAQAQGQPCGQLTDAAKTQQTQRAATDLAALRQRGARPAASGHGAAAGVDAAQQQHRRAHHILGHRQGIRTGGRNDLYASGFTGRHVDVVQPHAQTTHDLAALHRRQQGAPHLGAIAHDQRIGAGGFSQQPGRVVDQGRVVVHLMSGRQLGHGGRVHEFGDDYAHADVLLIEDGVPGAGARGLDGEGQARAVPCWVCSSSLAPDH